MVCAAALSSRVFHAPALVTTVGSPPSPGSSSHLLLTALFEPIPLGLSRPRPRPLERLANRLAKRRHGSSLDVITRRRILYWLAVMVAVLVAGTIIGLIWADTSNAAGSIAVATNIIGVVGIVVLVIALVVVTRRQRRVA